MRTFLERQNSTDRDSAATHSRGKAFNLAMKLYLMALIGMVGAISLTTPLSAGIFGRGACTNCDPCSRCHINPCSCGPVMPPPVVVPQTQTILQPQTITVPQTTYRDVVRTEYRTQAELQQTPVTRYRTVAVDEGAFQQVWVSRVVQKQVPETVMEQRTVYKSMPYQVTQRIPETTYVTQTQMVPRIVQTPVSTCDPCRTGAMSSPVLGWNTYSPTMISSPIGAPVPAYPTMVGAMPSTGYVSTLGREAEPLRSAINQPLDMAGPVPDPKFLDTPRAASNDWTPVSTAPTSRQPTRVSSASSRFVPVPAGSSATRIR